MNILRIARIAGVLAAFSIASCAQTTLTPEDLVTRHLASIGTAEARNAAKAQSYDGTVIVSIIRGGLGSMQGAAKFDSAGQKINLKMKLGAESYPGEDVSADASHVNVATVAPTMRSRLGYFYFTRNEILKEGLVGGTLSSAWPLLDLPAHQPKLSYQGIRKLDGRDLHDLRYKPRKGEGDLTIDLYFEPETFRHVATTYSFRVLAGAVTHADNSAGSSEGRYVMRESFADFQTANGLTRPTRWTIDLSWEGAGGWLQRWDMTLHPVP